MLHLDEVSEISHAFSREIGVKNQELRWCSDIIIVRVEVLSLASCYGDCMENYNLGGSRLSSCHRSRKALFWTVQSWLDTVTTCDLRHERVTMDGIEKHLVL